MGWTSEHVNDNCIKERLDNLFNDDCDVVRSAMVGRTYYAAVRTPEGNVIGAVILTSVNNRDWFNFSYKEMEESMGPNESRCPDSILKLLSPTESVWANEWRGRCREYNRRKRFLAKCPVGTSVVVDGCVYEKSVVPVSPFRKRKMWVDWTNWTKLPETRIAEHGFEEA